MEKVINLLDYRAMREFEEYNKDVLALVRADNEREDLWYLKRMLRQHQFAVIQQASERGLVVPPHTTVVQTNREESRVRYPSFFGVTVRHPKTHHPVPLFQYRISYRDHVNDQLQDYHHGYYQNRAVLDKFFPEMVKPLDSIFYGPFITINACLMPEDIVDPHSVLEPLQKEFAFTRATIRAVGEYVTFRAHRLLADGRYLVVTGHYNVSVADEFL